MPFGRRFHNCKNKNEKWYTQASPWPESSEVEKVVNSWAALHSRSSLGSGQWSKQKLCAEPTCYDKMWKGHSGQNQMGIHLIALEASWGFRSSNKEHQHASLWSHGDMPGPRVHGRWPCQPGQKRGGASHPHQNHHGKSGRGSYGHETNCHCLWKFHNSHTRNPR